MAKARKQRQYQEGTEYAVFGPSGKKGKFRLKGTARIEGREMLLFQRMRKVRKRRPRKRRSKAA